MIVDALCKALNVTSSGVKASLHLKLCDKYAREGEEPLKEGDYVQASEKFWGMASQAIKAVAAKRGLTMKSHGELYKFVADLREETGDPEVRRLWHAATELHRNFHKAWLPPTMVKEAVKDVKKLVGRLRAREL